VCELGDMRGLECLHGILGGASLAMLPAVKSPELRSTLDVDDCGIECDLEIGAMSSAQLNRALESALAAGRWQEAIAIREYKGQTIDHRGRRRKVPTAHELDVKAIGAAISRAITVIRKRCPRAADCLATGIVHEADGWTYTGPEWDAGKLVMTPDELAEWKAELKSHVRPDPEPAPEITYERCYYRENGRWVQGDGIASSKEPEDEATAIRGRWVESRRAKGAMLAALADRCWWDPKPKR
jgi:hypothetical protein